MKGRDIWEDARLGALAAGLIEARYRARCISCMSEANAFRALGSVGLKLRAEARSMSRPRPRRLTFPQASPHSQDESRGCSRPSFVPRPRREKSRGDLA